MQRWVKEADCHRQALHGLQDTLKVPLLHGQEPIQGAAALCLGSTEDHLPHHRQAVLLHKHVLGTAEPDAGSPKLAGLLGVDGIVGIGAYTNVPDVISPLQQGLKIRAQLGVNHGDLPLDDPPVGPVDGQPVPGGKGHPSDPQDLPLHVNTKGVAPDNTGLAHAPGHNRRVAGHPAPAGENPLGRDDTADVLRRCLRPYQEYRFTGLTQSLRLLGVEDNQTRGGPR